jgi:hypothetical protein
MKQRLRDLGYVRPTGELRVADFCLDHRFSGTMFYDFLADRRTPLRDLDRIAAALHTTPAWLCFGVSEVEAPSAAPAKAATGSARRGTVTLPERRVRTRRRVLPFPAPYPSLPGSGEGALCKVRKATRRVPRAA